MGRRKNTTSTRLSLCGARDIAIHPDLPDTAHRGQGQYSKVFNKAQRLIGDGYDHVHCLIDYDTVRHGGNTQAFEDECTRLRREYNTQLTIYINNPCFEFWLLLHYERTAPHFANCGQVETAISRYIANYSKRAQDIRRLCADIHPNIRQAIRNAWTVEQNRGEYAGLYHPRAEVYRLVERLVPADNG